MQYVVDQLIKSCKEGRGCSLQHLHANDRSPLIRLISSFISYILPVPTLRITGAVRYPTTLGAIHTHPHPHRLMMMMMMMEAHLSLSGCMRHWLFLRLSLMDEWKPLNHVVTTTSITMGKSCDSVGGEMETAKYPLGRCVGRCWDGASCPLS